MTKREYNQQYYKANKDKLIRESLAYRVANRAAINAKANAAYHADRERILAQKKEYHSRNKEIRNLKSREFYQANKQARKEYNKLYRTSHRDQTNANNRAYWLKHPEKKRAWQSKWNEKNRGRLNAYDAKRLAIEKSATIDAAAALWFYDVVHNQDVLTCAYCEKAIPAFKAHVDHIIPITRGGIHGPDNFCVACSSCNQSKSDKLLHEWVKCPSRILNLLAII